MEEENIGFIRSKQTLSRRQLNAMMNNLRRIRYRLYWIKNKLLAKEVCEAFEVSETTLYKWPR